MIIKLKSVKMNKLSNLKLALLHIIMIIYILLATKRNLLLILQFNITI